MEMARILLVALATASTARAGLGAAVALVVCAAALVMCASHALRRPSRRHKQDPVIHLDMDARIITTKRLQQQLTIIDDGGQRDVSGPQPQLCVWQKNILMGEKCQIPDFSGIIIYDSTGNLIPSAPPPCPDASSN